MKKGREKLKIENIIMILKLFLKTKHRITVQLQFPSANIAHMPFIRFNIYLMFDQFEK